MSTAAQNPTDEGVDQPEAKAKPSKGPPEPVPFPPAGCLWEAIHVAQYLQLSESWVYHEAAGGRLPSLKIGRKLRFDPDRIRAWATGSDPRGDNVVQLGGTR